MEHCNIQLKLLHAGIYLCERCGKVFVPNRGGWITEITPDENNSESSETRIYNPLPQNSGFLRWFEINTKPSPQGTPMLIKEPSLKIPVKIQEKTYEIAGIVILDKNNNITDRFSLSNLKFVREQKFEIRDNNDGTYEFLIEEKSCGYLNSIYNIDKNRVVGFEAIFTPTAPEEIQEYELETLGVLGAKQNQ